MSDTTTAPSAPTPTPADVAANVQPPTDAPPVEAPAQETGSEWERLFEGENPADVRRALDESRKWERRSKDNRTEAEQVAERLAEVEKRAAEAEARASRRDVAIEFRLSKEDAALLDAMTDEQAMRSLAQRLSTESDKQQRTNNISPREGTTPRVTDTDERTALRSLFGTG